MAKPQSSETAATVDGNKSSYEKWVEGEGIPVIKTFFVEDIRDVKLEWWQRKGGNGAFLQMEGAGQVTKRRSTSSAAGARPPFGTTKIASRLLNGRRAPCFHRRLIPGTSFSTAAAASRRVTWPSPPRRR